MINVTARKNSYSRQNKLRTIYEIVKLFQAEGAIMDIILPICIIIFLYVIPTGYGTKKIKRLNRTYDIK